MRKEIYYCDICNKQKRHEDIIFYSYRHDSFPENKIDICKDCLTQFKSTILRIRGDLSPMVERVK